jgi:solute carrier family 25 (mitochondrial iron transporter), member 28/37
MAQQQTPTASSTPVDEIHEDWEEWDGRSPFWIHCVAGSIAGVAEHALVYPLDTVRTHIQVCAACVHNKGKMQTVATSSLLRSALKSNAPPSSLPVGMWQTIRYLVNEPMAAAAGLAVGGTTIPVPLAPGWSRLWVGVQAILIGCIPAHALYFSSYELVKAASSTTTRDGHTHVSATGLSLAGAAAVVSHDIIMTPLDTMKQRMQLGHYNGSTQIALRSILQTEGLGALYRSFFFTVASNIPYGMVMVSVHERAKEAWMHPDVPVWQTVLAASSLGGFCASAVTAPLDRIKTALQTQQLTPACRLGIAAAANCQLLLPPHQSWSAAAGHILRTEGVAGFFRGVVPRVLSHTPAVAISWTTYETAKHYLLQRYQHA